MSAPTSAVAERLGKPTRVYTSNRWYLLVPWGLFLLTGVGMAVYGAASGSGGLVIVGVALSVAAIYQGYRRTAGFGWRVTVHENGLSSRDNRRTTPPDARRPVDITWDEIVWVKSKIPRRSEGLAGLAFERYRLGLGDGREFDLTAGLQRLSELALHVLDQVGTRAIPRVETAFNAGRAAEFGPVSFSRDGLRLLGGVIPIDKIALITFREGVLSIHRIDVREHASVSLDIAEIENFHVLHGLLREVLGSERVN